MKNPLSYIVLLTLVLSSCASTEPKEVSQPSTPCKNQNSPECSASSESSKFSLIVNEFVEIQERNFGSTVSFCHEVEPTSAKKIKAQYNSYIPFYRASMVSIWTELSTREEYKNEILGQSLEYSRDDELMAMQSKQGAQLLALAQSQPAQVCAKVAKMMSTETKYSLQKQVEDSLNEYKGRRAAYCAKQPTPENCK